MDNIEKIASEITIYSLTCYLCKQPITDERQRTCISEAAHKDCIRDHESQTDQYHYSLYYQLIHAVESKYPGESRHETALRYIREAESLRTGSCLILQEKPE